MDDWTFLAFMGLTAAGLVVLGWTWHLLRQGRIDEVHPGFRVEPTGIDRWSRPWAYWTNLAARAGCGLGLWAWGSLALPDAETRVICALVCLGLLGLVRQLLPAPAVDPREPLALRQAGPAQATLLRHEQLLQGGLARLQEELGGQLGQPVSPAWIARLSAELDGRPAHVAIEPGPRRGDPVTLRLGLGELQLPRWTGTRAELQRLEADAFPPDVQRLVIDPQVRRRALALLDEPGAATLELGPELALELRAGPRQLADRLRSRPPPGTRPDDGDAQRMANYLRDLLRQLGALAEAAQAQHRVGASLPGVSVASAAGGEDLICPYCRDQVQGSEGQRCPACRTLHHRECWAEAGGCTLLGCGGRKRRERERA